MKPNTDTPWWREPYLWLVISGPLSVIVACAITYAFIISQPDPLSTKDYYRKGIEINKTLEQAQAQMQPALTGRNHSATGGKK
jgi:hypothetical protein